MSEPSTQDVANIRKTINALIEGGHGFSEEFYSLNNLDFWVRNPPMFAPAPTASTVRQAIRAGWMLLTEEKE